MCPEAINLKFLDHTSLEVTFRDGYVKRYDMANLFDKYPQLKALEDRKLFLSGKLQSFGIIWTDELDIAIETIYEDGETIRIDDVPIATKVGCAVQVARCQAGISQSELAKRTGINQADISRIERGSANPSMATLDRIAKALDAKLSITIE